MASKSKGLLRQENGCEWADVLPSTACRIDRPKEARFYVGISRCTQEVAYWVSSPAFLRLSLRLICSR